MTTERVTLDDGEADQALIPGVAPIRPAARDIAALDAARRRRRCHGELPAGGLFDETARAQTSLF